MTQETVQAIYQELDSLVVPLEQNTEKGLMYLREKLLECRRKQDRVSEILVQINRELSVARGAVRALKMSVQVATGGDAREVPLLRGELGVYADTEDTLKYLMAATRLRRDNLRATSSDIRLMAHVIGDQIKLGEVQPPKDTTPPWEVEPPLPFDATPALALESEWPEGDTSKYAPKKRKPKHEIQLVDDGVDVNNIF